MKITLEFDSMEELTSFMSKGDHLTSEAIKRTPLGCEMDMPVRVLNALKAEGVLYVEEALKLKPSDILRMPNMGKHSMNQFIAWKMRKESPTD